MSKEMEGLIEEIQDIYKAGTERRTPNMSPQQLIARIGKAYADGQENLPGWQTIFRQICCWQEEEDGTQILTANAPDNGDYWLLRADDRGAIVLRKNEPE